ncbi:UPF0496 protein 4-like [Primulina huaijiensis]|uniref:UPF0496 protein 4-like n=1 Tax=Primulina huaijiensis TaxID=1492673 RepID=UPI003CC715AD
MVILLERFKFPVGIEVHNNKYKPPSTSLRSFRSEISNFMSQFLSKNLPLAGFDRYFEFIQLTNNAFAKLVVDIEHPMCEWGAKTREQYLSYSLNLLDLLNAISSSISHLNQSKISNLYALRLVESSPSFAAKRLKKIPKTTFDLGMDLKEEGWSVGIREKPNSKKETTVLDALTVVRRIGVLTLGLVLSSLCNDAKPYEDVRKIVLGSDDSLIKDLDTILGKDVEKTDGVIQEVNAAVDRLSADNSAGNWGKAAWDMKNLLETLENTIQGIEKKASSLFSEVLETRNELLAKFLGRQNMQL